MKIQSGTANMSSGSPLCSFKASKNLYLSGIVPPLSIDEPFIKYTCPFVRVN